MVFALAGDSTMTRRRSATSALFGSGDGILPGRSSAGCAGHHSGALDRRKCPERAILRIADVPDPRPSWPYLVLGGLSWPVLRLLYRRALAGGRAAARATAGTSSPRTTVELRSVAARDAALPAAVPALHGQVGALLVPARPVHHGRAAAFPVRRGERDEEAIETAVRLCRDGHVVVMFPEGTRREKGLRKTHEARWRTGAARIALEAGVPLVPGGDRRAPQADAPGASARRVRRRRSSSTTSRRCRVDDAAQRRDRPASGGDRRARGVAAVRPLLAVDGDSFAHRAFHALPRSFRRADGGPANTLIGFTSMLLRLWQAERPRAVVVGWDTLGAPTYRNELLADVPVRPRVRPRDRRAARPAAGARRRRPGSSAARRAGFEADDFLAAAVAAERARGGTTLVATSDRDAFQLAAPDVTILQPVRGRQRARADRPGRGARALRRRRRRRCRTSSRCAATRPTRSPAPAASARRPPRRSSQTSPISRRCSRPGGSRRRPTRSGRTARSRRSIRPLRCPTLPIVEPDWAAGAEAARARASSGSPPGSGRRGVEPITHPAMAHLHPTGHHHHPEREERLAVPARALRPELEGGRASARRSSALHDPEYVARIAAISRGGLARRRHARPADDLGGRAARRRLRDRGGRGRTASRSCARPVTTRSPTARWGSASSATS